MARSLMRRASAILFMLVIFDGCTGEPVEKWSRYVTDQNGIPVDTIDVSIYRNRIVLNAAGLRNWTKGKHDDVFVYDIISTFQLPGDPRKMVYRVKADNGQELMFHVYRVEKGMAAINFGDLVYSPGGKNAAWMIPKDTVKLCKDIEEVSWWSPWFFSDSLCQCLKTRKGIKEVNCDTIQWYYRTCSDYLRTHADRFRNWGEPGQNFMREQSATVVMIDKGYDPWRVYTQITMSKNGCTNVITDSLRMNYCHLIDSIWNTR